MADTHFTAPITPDLTEERLWREHAAPLMADLSKNVREICHYGFTEIVNNAIDHSAGRTLDATIAVTDKSVLISVGDDGVGIFNRVQEAMDLHDPRDATLELAKGKFTTDPARHTGEGVYFTLRALDSVTIMSGSLAWSVSAPSQTWAWSDEPMVNGTTVTFEIARDSPRHLKDVFDQSTSEGFRFSRTYVPVVLARYGDDNLISRSQAKRVAARFEQFDEVVLDFTGIEQVGQAFADEIFRVFANEHPEVRLSTIAANRQVHGMIQRALAAKDEAH